MTSIVGRGVRCEIGTTEGAAKTISAVTLANPGVATSTAHGLANKSLGYMSGVSGMVQLEGQAVRVANQASNTFELEDIETTDYGAFTGTCSFIPITAYATLGRITSYSKGGGEGDKLDDTVLLDDIKQELQGLLAAETVTFNLNPATISDTAMQLLRRTARKSGYLVFRITLKDGNVRFFRGQPSLPGEDVQKGQIGTGSFTVTMKGFVCEGAA
jgi:hypothetical protein